MTILTHNFNQINIAQLSEDTMIGGKQIPAGYVNATQMCKAGKKLFADWNRLKGSTLYLEELSLDMGIPISRNQSEVGIPISLLIELEGTPDGDASLQGTWVHQEVAIDIAAWISPKFKVWANRTLRLVLNGEFKPLTEEAIEAKKQLDKLYEEIRLAGKVTRRTLTDATKAYLDSNEVSDNYRQWVYSNCSDKINVALFGKKASKLCTERGCERDELRDTHDRASLALIDRIEGHAVRLIDRGMEPQLATTDAIKFYS